MHSSYAKSYVDSDPLETAHIGGGSLDIMQKYYSSTTKQEGSEDDQSQSREDPVDNEEEVSIPSMFPDEKVSVTYNRGLRIRFLIILETPNKIRSILIPEGAMSQMQENILWKASTDSSIQSVFLAIILREPEDSLAQMVNWLPSGRRKAFKIGEPEARKFVLPERSIIENWSFAVGKNLTAFRFTFGPNE